jgi:hypothetical protein
VASVRVAVAARRVWIAFMVGESAALSLGGFADSLYPLLEVELNQRWSALVVEDVGVPTLPATVLLGGLIHSVLLKGFRTYAMEAKVKTVVKTTTTTGEQQLKRCGEKRADEIPEKPTPCQRSPKKQLDFMFNVGTRFQ